MSVKRLIVAHCCCCLLLIATGCRSETETVQQSTTNTTQQTSSTQTAAANSNGTAATSNVAGDQNITSQNSNTTAAQTAQKLDPCSLITPSEIASVQGEEVKESKAAPGNSSRLAVAQCFYQTTTPSKSVSLEVTQRLSAQPGALSPREFWKESFEHEERDGERGREGKRETEKERKREAEKREARGGEEEEEGNPPLRIAGLGDEAFWASNVRAGALYVLKGSSIIRISVGGIADQNVRLEKSKALAQAALKRLKD
jgi:hypothetical protein